MVGGIVIGITRNPETGTHVHVADCPHYPKHGQGDECPCPDTCCVYVEERKCPSKTKREGPFGESVEIGLGDSLWWQCGICYWTPKANRGKTGNKKGVDFDVPLLKIGYSH